MFDHSIISMSLSKGIMHPENRSLLVSVGVGAVIIGGLVYWWSTRDESCSTKRGGCAKTGECGSKTCEGPACTNGSKKTAPVTTEKAGQHAHSTRTTGTESTNKIATVSLPGAEERVKKFKDLYLAKFVDIKKAAIHDERNSALEYNTLVNIQNLVLEITSRDVPQILKINRETRRKVMDTDKKEYARIVKQGLQDLNTLYTQNLEEVLRDFGVSKDIYESAVNTHARTDATVRITPADLSEILVGRLESYNEPRDNTPEYFANIYKDVQKRLTGVSLVTSDPELQGEIRAHIILDTVQRETGLEEEDIKHLRLKHDTPELKAFDEDFATDIEKSKSK